MKISLGLAKLLLELLENNTVAYSRFPKNEPFKRLQEDAVITVSGRRRKTVQLTSADILQNYLHNHYGISNLREYIKVLLDQDSNRTDFIKVSTNSKIKRKGVFEGFLIHSYKEIYGRLNEEKILLKPVSGSLIFINDYKSFSIDPEITIIVVENFANFKYIAKQEQLFKHIEKPLFAWRYQTACLANWLANMKNDYVHFGDYDLSGLAIYIREFKHKRASQLKNHYLIPDNIESMIHNYGNRERYFAQLENTKGLDFALYPEISDLASIIKQYQKSLEQEIFIDL